MDKLRTLELFIATCDKGSFASAAQACGSDPSTVSKAISRLESELGFTLFQRSTRQLRITQAGEQYAATARKVIKDLVSCEFELKNANDTPAGKLKISSAVCYAHLYLRPMIKAFSEHYPDIQIELEVNDLHVDIIENDIDIALRTGFVKDSRLVARCISPMDFLICASPSYIEQNGLPTCIEQYHQHPWIGFKIKQTQQLQPIFIPDQSGQYQHVDLTPCHITDDGEAMAHMCIDGLGLAQLPHFLVKSALENNQLVSLYPSFRPPQSDAGVFAIYPKRTYLPTKVRVFIDFLIEFLTKQDETSTKTWAQSWPPYK